MDNNEEKWEYRGIHCVVRLVRLRDEPGYSGNGLVVLPGDEKNTSDVVTMPPDAKYQTEDEAINQIKAKQKIYIDKYFGGA